MNSLPLPASSTKLFLPEPHATHVHKNPYEHALTKLQAYYIGHMHTRPLTACAYTCTYMSTCDVLQASMLNARVNERELRATKEKMEMGQKLASLGQTKRSLEDELRALKQKVSVTAETQQELVSLSKAKRSLNGELVDLESKKQETQNQVHYYLHILAVVFCLWISVCIAFT